MKEKAESANTFRGSKRKYYTNISIFFNNWNLLSIIREIPTLI